MVLDEAPTVSALEEKKRAKPAVKRFMLRDERTEALAEALLQSNSALEQLIRATAHDLSEPVRIASLYLQLFMRRYADEVPEEGKEYLQFALKATEQMSDLIRGLLAFEHVGKAEAIFDKIDLNFLLEDILKTFAPQIQALKAKIEMVKLPAVHGINMQIRLLLENLLSNALKFRSAQSPEIRISFQEKKTEYIFKMEDNGVGFDARSSRVFQMFRRLHSEGHSEGIGMGLAISKRIVQRHGGRIWAESRAGEGSSFFFSLPRR